MSTFEQVQHFFGVRAPLRHVKWVHCRHNRAVAAPNGRLPPAHGPAPPPTAWGISSAFSGPHRHHQHLKPPRAGSPVPWLHVRMWCVVSMATETPAQCGESRPVSCVAAARWWGSVFVCFSPCERGIVAKSPLNCASLNFVSDGRTHGFGCPMVSATQPCCRLAAA